MKKYFLFNQIDKTQIGDLQIEQIVSLIKTFKNVDDWHIWSPGDAGWTAITQSQVYTMFFADGAQQPTVTAAAPPPPPPPPGPSVATQEKPAEDANRLVSFADPNIDKVGATPNRTVFDEEETFVDFENDGNEPQMNAPTPIVEHKVSEPVQVSNYAEPEFEVFEMPSTSVPEASAAATPELPAPVEAAPAMEASAPEAVASSEPPPRLPMGLPSMVGPQLPKSVPAPAAVAAPPVVAPVVAAPIAEAPVEDNHDDRRKYPRIKARLRAIITNKDKTFLTNCKDISMGGISVEHNIPEYVFSGECEVYICGANGKESIVFKCTPVGESAHPNRIKFSDHDGRYKDKLAHWLEAFIQGQTKKTA